MWRRISHTLHTVCYWVFPAGTTVLGVYLTYRATQYDGAMSIRAYLFGIGLLLGTWAWTASRSARHKAASDAKLAMLEGRVEYLEEGFTAVLDAVDLSEATAAVLDAVEHRPTAPSPRTSPGRADTSAAVIRLDQHTGT